MRPIRVLVVDDSAFARKVLRESISREADLEVVGVAHDGLDGLEKIAQLKPDVITLDLVMPHLDGVGLLRALKEKPGWMPSVVLVSMADADSDLVLSALSLGALDFVHKPTALATERLYELAGEAVAKIRAVALARPQLETELAHDGYSKAVPTTESLEIPPALVVLGTSTGGPQALTQVIPQLPADFPLPVVMVLHIPVGYTEGVAARLSAASALEVLEAQPGMELKPGRVILAQAGWHCRLRRSFLGGAITVELSKEPADSLHRPSVDVLFESAAKLLGPRVLGVVLTGMGTDGLEGSRAIHAAGGTVISESASSAVIYGMPRAVHEAGLTLGQADLRDMAPLIVRLCTGAKVAG